MDSPDILPIPELLARSVARHGDLPAIRTAAGSLDYRELGRRTDGIAASLAERGVRPGERIGLYSPNSVEFVLSYLAIAKAGAVVVPVNVLLSAAEVAWILDDAEVSGLFHHPILTQNVEAIASLRRGSGFRIALEGEEWAAMAASSLSPPQLELDAAEDLLAVLYTSGTTGRPKGAMLTHRNLAANTWSVSRAIAARPGEDVILVVLPMFHSFAATCGMLTSLLHGLSLVPLPRFDPEEVARAIAAHGATIFMGVPAMYRVLLRLPAEHTAALRELRLCVSGGAALSADVLRRFEERFGVPLLEGDGPTECSPVTCINPLDGVRKPGSVGRPVSLVEMRILDGLGAELECGEVGELCVRGPSVMKGYWRQPGATEESFFGEWFRTGDLAHRDEDGYFFIVDRLKDMLIVNGVNVYPRAVEDALAEHPSVAEAAVVGEPHRLHGEIPVAHVVLHEGGTPDRAALQVHCRERLGRHELPRRYLFREALPRNATGKVLKRELRRQGEIERGIDLREDA